MCVESVKSKLIPGKTNGRRTTARDSCINFDNFLEYHLGKAPRQTSHFADLHCQKEEEKSVVKKAKEQKRKANHMHRGLRKRRSGKWAAEIRDPIKGIRVWLGTYSSPEEAAMVYDREAQKIKDRKAKLNFPPRVITTDNSRNKVNVSLQSMSNTSESYSYCPANYCPENCKEKSVEIHLPIHDKESELPIPEVPEATVNEYMETLERMLEMNPQTTNLQCFSVGADFNNDVLQSDESQVICSSPTYRKKTHELLGESSVSLDSIFEDVYGYRNQLEFPISFENMEGLLEWEMGLYESPCLWGRQIEFLQQACIRV